MGSDRDGRRHRLRLGQLARLNPRGTLDDLDLDARPHLKGNLVEFEELCVADSRYVLVLFEIGDGVS
ncbi:MAG: hypothetical protein P8I99_10525 [Acidimicrobiales bacterium]|nr:hypothetical protein [Acidimicrobiales bacterium]MDG1877830.1 hypothetical protein [Acidimicrobiales bacterium]